MLSIRVRQRQKQEEIFWRKVALGDFSEVMFAL
jgi:hypothetical protein